MSIANFFWHGPKLRLYEQACLTSFVNAGFEVRLHTFESSLAVPAGVSIFPASAHAQLDEVLSFTHGGKPKSIAAFTDVFRYRLFSQESGWWFDTDVFCLSHHSKFEELASLSPGLIVGAQDERIVNNAVIYVSDPAVARDLSARAEALGKVIEWGAIGPGLMTEYCNLFPERSLIVEKKRFYPIHYLDSRRLLLPDDLQYCREEAQGALAVHLWNEIIGRWKVPQNIMPSEGSFLNQLFKQSGVTVEPDASLSPETLKMLIGFGDISPLGHKAIKFINRIRKLRDRMLRK